MNDYSLSESKAKDVIMLASNALAKYCIDNNIHYLITGVSGGLDSAVTLGLAERACWLARQKYFNLTSVGLILPCQSSNASKSLGQKVVEKFSAKLIEEDFSPLFDYMERNIFSNLYRKINEIMCITNDTEFQNDFSESKKTAEGNIKARIRMMLGTYHVARMMRGMVLSTDNLSELWMAFWTLHGDVGDYGMIQNVLKGTELYDIARVLGVPQEIINAKPDDGLGIAGGDEDQLGANYQVIDEIMIKLIQAGFDPDGSSDQLSRLPETGLDYGIELITKIAKRCLDGSFKRKNPITLSRKDLGLWPIESRLSKTTEEK
jgi:NAD+ synthase